MMKKLTIAALLFGCILALPAQAKPKFMGFIWWPSHWRDQDFQPYYEDSKGPHNTQWDDKELNDSRWSAQDWIALDGGNGPELVRKWYVAQIIKDQYVKKGVPYVEVGSNFYHLGGADKRRVADTLDAVYKYTAQAPQLYLLTDFRTNRVIGEYTKSGLVLQ